MSPSGDIKKNMVNAASKRPEVFLENAVFYLSLLFLAAVIGAFFYVRFLIVQSNDELKIATEQLQKAKTAEQKKLENRVMLARRQITDFSKIVAERKFGTGFFGNLENLTLNDVYFSKCELDMTKMAATLTGHSGNFQDLSKQMSRFVGAPVFTAVSLNKAGSGETAIDFTANVLLDKAAVAKNGGNPPLDNLE